MFKYCLISLSLSCFLLGNIVYSPFLSMPWYIRSILSEFMFVLMYTIVDYGNFTYKTRFAVIHLFLITIFYLPLFGFLFYDRTAQIFSVTISLIAIAVNARILNFLYFNKGLTRLLSSRLSSTLASIIEIILFSSILHLGLKGAVLMSFLRLVYIATVPRLVFKK